jgi:MoaA/NifB/PqqE/SkfB family radical SAM enzyme
MLEKKIEDLFDVSYLDEEGINVRDLMFFVNTGCNLRCKHCYVGQDKQKNVEFSRDEALDILNFFGSRGLERLTFLGGEPTIYPHISELIKVASEYEIPEKRITTNGIDITFMDSIDATALDHISFSLDGHNPRLHEFLRGKGTFQKTLDNLRRAQDKGFTTNVTYSVNGLNKDYVEEGLPFFRDMGINEVNFHLTSMIGDAKGNDILYVKPSEWVELRKRLVQPASHLKGLKLRIPSMFVDREEYRQELVNGYSCLINGSYHSKDGGNRILLYPTGKAYVCCKLSSSEFNFGFFRNGTFLPNPSNNELCEVKKHPRHPCVASKLLGEETEGYVPLCISYKKKVEF